MARDLTNAYLASPNQASTVFGVGGAHPIRQKNAFVVRFLRKTGEGGEDWKNGLTFLVKSVDRPTITPVTEEINQWNKKRVIHTGVKYTPVNCVIYDTADSAAMSMLVEYSQYYFGDFRQNPSAYADDIVSGNMFGTSGRTSTSGFGFTIPETSVSSIDGANSQYFFDRVEIYQVWGGEYTCFQLINPRITSYDPDNLDFEDSGASTITINFQYETVFYENAGKPQKISGNAALVEIFGGEFNGNVFDPQPSPVRTTDFTSIAEPAPTPTAMRGDPNGLEEIIRSLEGVEEESNTTSAGGKLSQYGQFDFGDFTELGSNLPSELSTVTHSEVANKTLNRDIGSIATLKDITKGVGTAAVLHNEDVEEHVREVEYTVYRTTEQEPDPFEVEWTYPPPNTDQMPQPAPNSAVVTSGTNGKKYGLGLSKTAIAVVNTRSDGRSLIGKRNPSSANPMLSYIVEPKPSALISPPMSYGRIKDANIVFNGFGRIAHYPLPNAGTMAKPITIRANITGKSEPAGKIASTISVIAALRVVNTISGSVNRPVSVRAQGLTGWATVSGSSNPSAGNPRPITIRLSSSARGHTTVSGFVDRARPVFRTIAQGQVLTRAATIYRQINVQRAIRGWAMVSGSVLRPIPIKGNALIVFPLTGQMSKPLAIGSNIRATHVMLRNGAVSATVRVTSNIAAKSVLPVVGAISKHVPVSGLTVGHHQQPRRGTINGPVRFGISAFAEQRPFGRINRPIVITGALRGQQHLFGTLNRPLVIGRNIRGSNRVFGTVNRPVNIGRSISGFVVTNLSDSHRYWRLRMTSDQPVVGPNEIQFRVADGTAVTGTVTSSSSYGTGYEAAKAFDRDGGTWWSSGVGAALNSWVAVDLGAGNDRNVANVLIATDSAARVPQTYQLQYSDDGVVWTNKAVGSVIEPEDNSIYVTSRVSVDPDVSQTTQYRGMYRFRTTANSGDRVGMSYFALHNPAGLPIPAMSPFASSTSTGDATDAFDTDGGTMWVSTPEEAQSAELTFYAATLDAFIGSVTIQAGPNAGDGEMVPLGFVVEYSADDGDNWNIVYQQETMDPFSDGELRVITFTISGAVDIGDGSVLAVNDNNDVLGY